MSIYLGWICAIYHSLFVVFNIINIMFKIVIILFERLMVISVKYLPYFNDEDKAEVREIMKEFKKFSRRRT